MRLVIFDVDGTLYDQRPLRLKMLFALLRYYLARPARYKELAVLYQFRKEREKRPGYTGNNLEQEQYQWAVAKTGVPADKINAIVKQWMYRFPLQFLSQYKFKEAEHLMTLLHANNIKTAVYSDYPVVDKLKAMGLATNKAVCSTDPNVNSLKPAPRAITVICAYFGVPKENCLFIGDRDSRDGACARNAGIAYIILPHNSTQKRKVFVHLASCFNNKTKS